MKDNSLRTLIVDDSEDDVLLVIRELIKGGYRPEYERVDSAPAMKNALKAKPWDIILCDYKMPSFSGPAAIALLKELNIDIPLIIVSGAITEATAVECLRLGARDYVMKSNLSRLCPAIARELEEAKGRSNQIRAEEALRKSEKLFKEITENSSDILMITDANGDIKYTSRSIERFTGYKPEEIIGKSAFAFVHPDDVERAMADYSKAILQDENILLHNGFRIIHKDGSEVYMDGLGKNLLNNPDIAGFVMNVRDVTESKRAEENLKREQERFRALAELSPDIIVLVDHDKKIIYENPAVETILGYKTADRIGWNVFDNLHARDLNFVTEAFNSLMSDQGSVSRKNEIRIRHHNGGWLTFEVVASPLKKDNVVEALIINLHDITERKQAQEALRESNKALHTLYSISDDIEKAKSVEEGLKLSADIMAQGFHYPKYARVRIIFGDKEFKNAELEERSLKISADIILRDKPVGRVEVYYPDDFPDKDEGPFTKGERMLLEAIAQRLSRFAERKTYEMERDVMVSELRQALAEIKQLSGLLPICSSCKKVRNDNGYWEQIEGYISNHSQAEFSHGICPECAEKMTASDDKQSQSGNTAEKVRVLFVDDEKDFRHLFIRQLKRMAKDLEFEFIEAPDAETALRMLKEEAKPSFMIIDYALPGIDGMELLKRIDSDYPVLYNVPRIMLSGYSGEQLKHEAQILRCEFFEKGLDMEQLCRQIYQYMKARLGLSSVNQEAPVNAPLLM
ncbi:MAG TPA: PAS domain S-box protein [Smithella sp.]|nr:PAS domain S-box protein [Smithella sp.]